ncbi:RrF2 family transcriptional regulator [Candidatus Magnetominusculus xianensis]|uniref:Rrf2 family transcriptional regulator n=1 Tax=Candidatus Magnetominusculus xianensis TaxID=1748249 RepID=A0ABR5SEF3_9BACT|nr:RrF2 family transcriptional regulator [Candidatus Magnetominusculus xianensis]KWT82488.1 Rrf2 family transcriptional regulator [Candidatus Magnetominusculus xianensis]MBF0403208.1 RrF2 family transcriptional regulator [Nitrospirota bacterium]
MLRLSTRCQYGVRAMYEIARGYPETPVTIKVISEKQDVSVAFLEQILGKLRKAGLIRSVKGPGGGYMLKAAPEEISIEEILMVLEGPISITACVTQEENTGGCVKADHCVIQHLWKALGRQIEDFLTTITLQDLLEGRHFNPVLQHGVVEEAVCR